MAPRPPGRPSPPATTTRSSLAWPNGGTGCYLRCGGVTTASAGLSTRTPVADIREDLHHGSGLMVSPRPASRGCTSPMARVTVERPTPNQQAGKSCVTAWRRCTSVAGRRPTKTGRCFAPTLTTPCHGWGRVLKNHECASCRLAQTADSVDTTSHLPNKDSPADLASTEEAVLSSWHRYWGSYPCPAAWRQMARTTRRACPCPR